MNEYFLFGGIGLGGVVLLGWVIFLMVREKSGQISQLQNALRVQEAKTIAFQEENVGLQKENAELKERVEQHKVSLQEKIEHFNQIQRQLSDSFKALSVDALKNNSQSFLELAAARFEKLQETTRIDMDYRRKSVDELIKPIYETLEKVGTSHQELKKTLTVTHTSISEQVKGLATAQIRLENETTNLTKALRMPHVRGRWGEMQLRRVVEISGMIEHCDFIEQPTAFQDDKRSRPDMVIKLPGGKQIIVDSKAPLQAYLDALESENEDERAMKLRDHARQIKSHIIQLSSKSYWEQFSMAPEFVVLFLPGETFFSAALQQDPSLIEYGVDQKVILATPTTFIALLRSAAYGWRQEAIAENAQKISALGQSLYERIAVFAEHFIEIKKGLERTIEAYNKSIGSFESRILVAARKLKDTGAGTFDEISSPSVIDKIPKPLIRNELGLDE